MRLVSNKIQAILDDHVTTAEAAQLLKRTRRLIQTLCTRGAFPGAVLIGREWYIPKKAVMARKRLGKRKLPKGGRGVKAYAA